jgi:uncharacterized OB-fold protein
MGKYFEPDYRAKKPVTFDQWKRYMESNAEPPSGIVRKMAKHPGKQCEKCGVRHSSTYLVCPYCEASQKRSVLC